MLLTQCPRCSTIFRVRTEQLGQADGRASCGACGTVFDALINLREGLPGGVHGLQPPPGFSLGALATTTATERGPAPRSGEPVFDLSDLPPLDDDDLTLSDDDIAAVLEEEGFSARDPRAPSAASARGRRWPKGLAWGIGCVVLTLLLATQGMLSRQAVAGFPPLKALARTVCDMAGCRLPLPRAPYRLGLVSRDVQPHPTVDDALLISATMVNRAPFPQQWPVLEVTLADLNGELVAMRRFGPETYLNADMDRDAGMPPDTPIHVVFETEDPGDQTVAFEFQFR